MATNPKHAKVPAWRRLLDTLRKTHTELKRLAPYRDDGLVPRPSASPEEIEAAELRLGVQLPAAYREFLGYSNGWERFFAGAKLFGTDELGALELRGEACSLLEQSLPTGFGQDRFIVPFGADAQRTTLFAFDYMRGGREPAVLAWVEELGVDAGSFVEFLEFLTNVSHSDLLAHREHEAAVEEALRTSAA